MPTHHEKKCCRSTTSAGQARARDSAAGQDAPDAVGGYGRVRGYMAYAARIVGCPPEMNTARQYIETLWRRRRQRRATHDHADH